ncbi:MAG: putative nucleotidyltransferase substrate binding domain-containing protein [Oryzomonas sp.]|jgi:signal-transduction protein with cAMP-binding, CBS, and nucleotidyltransferase domain
MAVLATAKGSDISAWRAAGEFGAAFRQALLKRSALCRSEEAEALFGETCHALEALAAENDERVARLEGIVAQTAASADPSRLGELCSAFYAELYDHFGCYGSAVAFYHLSSLFLRELTGSLNRYALQRLGWSGEQLPDMALVAMGPTGRREFSPFCPLQLALVSGQTADGEMEAVSRYCGVLQEGFEACGLQVDGEISPLNSPWRGSLPEWGRRLEQGLARGKQRELVELLRLADHEPLHPTGVVGEEFRALVLSQLQQSRRALGDLVTRLGRLSNGLGIMGGWRLERSGPHRGLFRLFEHALLPLSAAVSALVLINRVDAVDIPLRIRALLGRGVLDVDTAERLLQSWHILNELRLLRERELFPSRNRAAALYLDVTALDEEKRRMLREALETINNVQRRVSVVHSGTEE